MPHSNIDVRARKFAQRLRREETEWERRLWRRLREFRTQGVHFRRQTPIGPYVADFGWLGGRLLIELDGDQHAWRAGHDLERDEWLRRRGFRVMRFWNLEVRDNIDGVMEAILRAVEDNSIQGGPR